MRTRENGSRMNHARLAEMITGRVLNVDNVNQLSHYFFAAQDDLCGGNESDFTGVIVQGWMGRYGVARCGLNLGLQFNGGIPGRGRLPGLCSPGEESKEKRSSAAYCYENGGGRQQGGIEERSAAESSKKVCRWRDL